MAKKIDWTNHIIEFITVVVGILLAFGLTNYNQNKADKEQAFQYLDGIKKEIEVNLIEIDKKLPYHQKLLDGLQNDPLNTKIRIRSARLTNYAWNMAENNIFKKHTDYDTYFYLANVYSIQERLVLHNRETTKSMTRLNSIAPLYGLAGGREAIEMSRDTFFLKAMKDGWVPIFQDMVSYEKDLQNIYKITLEKLNE